MAELTVDTPVLIIGAGPVGLTTAVSLTARGIKCRIIDKAPQASDKSKALVVHSRTLELLENIGLVEPFLAIGHKVHATNFCHMDKTLVHLSFDEMECTYPFALMIPQSETERLLTDHLSSLGLQIERGVEMTAFEQSVTHVNAQLKRVDGTTENLTCRWLLGCDGAHSTTRHQLGMSFEGAVYQESFATADVHVAWNKPQDEIIGFVHEDGVMFFFPLGGHRYRIIADGPLHKTGDPLSLEDMQKTIRERGASDAVLSDPIWLTWFTVSRRSAENCRDDRAFLIGDAAHIHSPALGQGMNTGMQDALNLAWKLALVEKGMADTELLDTYQEERHPVGQDLLKLTDAITKGIMIRNPVVQAVRNKLIPLLANHDVVQHRAWKTVSMLGINYRNSSLVGEHREALPEAFLEAPAWLEFAHGPAPGDRAPDGDVNYNEAATTLFEGIKGNQHQLLFFVGLAKSGQHHGDTTGSAINELKKLIKDLGSHFDEQILRFHAICPGSKATELHQSFDAQNDTQMARVTVLTDEQNMLHHRYGATHSCAYLVRPDGYVGFKSQPVDLDAIKANLAKTFSATLTDESTK